MQNYQNVASSIELFFVKILLWTWSVIEKPGNVKICLRKSINVNKNQRGASSIELFFVKILLWTWSVIEKPGNVKVCLRKSINANKNQRGARYSKMLSYSKSTVTSPPVLVK